MKPKRREFKARQFIPVNRAGIQTDLIFSDERFIKGGMTEYDLLAKIIIRMNKVIPNPEKIIYRLRIHLNAGSETRMYNIIGFQLNKRTKALDKFDVIHWNG